MPKKPYNEQLPPDLAKALHTRPTLAVIFRSLPPEEQNRYVDWIVHANTLETTRERISATIKALEAKANAKK
ncbi:MAG: YdeI/OmpD-associated family protein [Candidatus Kerfeldbacteria bacterium]